MMRSCHAWLQIKALQDSIESTDGDQAEAETIATEQLWVDKYAPSSFTELLSDEHTNREVCFILLTHVFTNI